jgi:phage terminase large subunit-like protein
MAPPHPELRGSTEPRISVVPTGLSARGAEAVTFAREVLDVDLMPWQQLVLDRACRTREDGSWRYRTVCTVVSRQVGKSFMTACRILAGMCLWGEHMVIAASQSRDVSLESWRHAVALAEDAGLSIERVHRASGREELVLDIDGHRARYKVVTGSAGGPRGLSADLVVLDELRQFQRFDVWASIEKTRRARPSSQFWTISTAGTIESVVLNRLQEQGRAAAEAGATDGPLMYMEWSAPDDADPGDPAGWALACPALGYTVTAETIAAEHATDPAEVFEMEVLGRTVTGGRPWLPPGAWDRCTDPAATVPDSAVHEVVFGLDANPDLSHASISVAWRRPDGRTHVELVSSHDSTWSAETTLRRLVERWQPRCLALIGKGPAEPVGARLGAEGVDLCALSGADVDRAARSFYEAASAGRLTHPADPVLAAHLEGAQGSSPGLLAIKGTPIGLDITGAVAAVVAVWALERTPVVTVPTWVAW